MLSAGSTLKDGCGSTLSHGASGFSFLHSSLRRVVVVVVGGWHCDWTGANLPQFPFQSIMRRTVRTVGPSPWPPAPPSFLPRGGPPSSPWWARPVAA